MLVFNRGPLAAEKEHAMVKVGRPENRRKEADRGGAYHGPGPWPQWWPQDHWPSGRWLYQADQKSVRRTVASSRSIGRCGKGWLCFLGSQIKEICINWWGSGHFDWEKRHRLQVRNKHTSTPNYNLCIVCSFSCFLRVYSNFRVRPTI